MCFIIKDFQPVDMKVHVKSDPEKQISMQLKCLCEKPFISGGGKLISKLLCVFQESVLLAKNRSFVLFGA